MGALEITAFDARSMFKLLDRDGSGLIDIDEFCDGCLRMKGEAKSFDIQCLIYESQRLISKTTGLTEHLEESIRELDETLRSSTESVKRTVKKGFDQVRRPSQMPRTLPALATQEDEYQMPLTLPASATQEHESMYQF